MKQWSGYYYHHHHHHYTIMTNQFVIMLFFRKAVSTQGVFREIRRCIFFFAPRNKKRRSPLTNQSAVTTVFLGMWCGGFQLDLVLQKRRDLATRERNL